MFQKPSNCTTFWANQMKWTTCKLAYMQHKNRIPRRYKSKTQFKPSITAKSNLIFCRVHKEIRLRIPVVPCSLVDRYQRFGRIFCFSTMKTEASGSSEKLIYGYQITRCHRAIWLKLWHYRLVFWRCSVWISAGAPINLTEVSHSFLGPSGQIPEWYHTRFLPHPYHFTRR
jgi:hypothetical protein